MNDLSSLDRLHLWHPYTQAQTAPEPVVIQAGEGAHLFAADGREYLDLISSWWVNLHGHAHPAIAQAIAAQAGTLEQVIFADFTHAPAIALARQIAELLPGDLTRAFFSDDGSTSVEVALKIAHQYWRNRGEERTTFIAFEGGYHGDTFGAMSAGASSGFFRAWEGLLFPVDWAPFPATWEADERIAERETECLAHLDALFERRSGKVSAVLVEPLVQGASGMRMCRPSFLAKLAERVREHGSLLIFDEVMTGFGRTGALFACLKAQVEPDLICLSKGLTGGFMPLGLTVCREAIYQAFLGEGLERAFLHGHSFTANPLGCAAGLASLALLLEPACSRRIAAIEAIHRARLGALAAHPRVQKVRVTGTIAALDVAAEAAGYGSSLGPKLKAFFFERRLILRPLGNVIYLLPPYCIAENDLHRAWDAVEEALEKVTDPKAS